MRVNSCWFLAIVLVACFSSECNAAEPSVYVKIKFSFTWTEMCNLENYLKKNLAKQVVLNDGSTLPAERIILYNFDDYCPKGAYEKANVYIFVSNLTNGNKDTSYIDEKMTIKIYKVVHYLREQKLERYLGSLFVGKIESVEVAGDNAPEKSDAYTEIERLYIGIGVALIIIIVIIVISAIVVLCKNKKNKENNANHDSGYASHVKGNDNVAVRTYPELSSRRNEAYNEGEENQPDHGFQTRL